MNFGAATTEVKAVKWRDIYANCIEDLANLPSGKRLGSSVLL